MSKLPGAVSAVTPLDDALCPHCVYARFYYCAAHAGRGAA